MSFQTLFNISDNSIANNYLILLHSKEKYKNIIYFVVSNVFIFIL